MIKRGKTSLTVLVLIVIFFSVKVFAGDLFSLQGNVDDSSGLKLSSGGVVVEIWDGPDVAGSNLIYNSTDNFTGSANISTGKFDIVLGSVGDELNLEYGRVYYMDFYIEKDNVRENMNFSGAERQPFMSSIGTINSSFLNVSNDYTMGSLTINNLTATTILLNVSHGTDLLIVNSTGIDLGSGLLYVDPLTSRVGIGTTAPSYALDVQNFAVFANLAHFSANVSMADNLTVGGNALYVDSSSGNVGIGLTNPQDYVYFGDAQLLIKGPSNTGIKLISADADAGNGYIRFADNTGTGRYAGAILYTHGVNTFDFSTNAVNRYRIDGNGKHWWHFLNYDYSGEADYEGLSLTLAAGSITFAAETKGTGTDNINIILSPAGTGSVGIGTTNPQYLLEVVGNASLGNTLFVTNDSNVGIGTTTPANTLNVVGDLNVTGNSYLGNMTFTDNATFIDSVNISEDLEAGGTLFVDGRNGRVGIGTTSPGDTLHVSGGGIRVDNGQWINFGGNLVLAADTSIVYFRSVNAAGGFIFEGSDGTDRMIITSTGNVGIGTTTPTRLLHLVKSENNETVTDLLSLDLTNSSGDVGAGIGPGIVFRASDNAGEVENISMIAGVMENVGNASERGALVFYTGYGDENGQISNLSSSEAIRINSTGITIGSGISPTITAPSGLTINSPSVITVTSSSTLILEGTSYVFIRPNPSDDSSAVVLQPGTLWPRTNLGVGLGSSSFYWNGLYTSFVYTTGKVGIGTTAPGYLLDVKGNASLNDTLYVTEAGQVGIGTTSPTALLHLQNDSSAVTDAYLNISDSGVQKFVVDTTGAVTASSSVTATGFVGTSTSSTFQAAANGNSPQYTFVGSGGNGMGQESQSTVIQNGWASAGSGVVFKTGEGTPSEKMRVTTSGTVGIGTTSPGATLEVVNSSAVSALFNVTDGSDTRLIINGAGNVGIGTSTPGALLETVGGDVNITNGSDVGIYFNSTTGSVSIGKTIIGENKIQIYSTDDTTTNYERLVLKALPNDAVHLIHEKAGTGTYRDFYITSTYGLYLNANSGTINFRDTTGTYNEHEFGTLPYAVYYNIYNGNSVSNREYVSFNWMTVTDEFHISTAITGSGLYRPININSQGSNIILQSGSGNVGIGTTNPLYKLEVLDNASLSNTLFVTNSSTVGIGTSSPGATLEVVNASAVTNILNVSHGDDMLVVNATGIDLDSSTLFVDSINNKVGIGTTAPTHALTFPQSSTGIALYNTADQETNYERGYMRWSGDALYFGTEKGGSGTQRDVHYSGGSTYMYLDASAYMLLTIGGVNKILFQGAGFNPTSNNLADFGLGSLDRRWAYANFYNLYLNTALYGGLNVSGLDIPSAPSGTAQTSGGSMADGTYYYVITTVSSAGETLNSTQSSAVTISGGGGSGSVALEWTRVMGAKSYKIYRTTTSGVYTTPSYITNVDAASYTDTAASASSGAPPTVDTSDLVALNKVVIGNPDTPSNSSMYLTISGGDLNVSGSIYYGGASTTGSPMVIQSVDGEPIPICMKNSEGKWVGCMPDANNNWKCEHNEECDKKVLRVETERKLKSEGVDDEEIGKKVESLRLKFEQGKNLQAIKEEVRAEIGDMSVLNELDDSKPKFSLQTSSSEVSALVGEFNSLKSENDLLKSELCKKDNTYSWCPAVEQSVAQQETPVEQLVEEPSQGSANNPPVVDSFMPEAVPVMSIGDSQEFTVTVSDADENDVLTTQWYVNNLPIADQVSNSFTYTASTSGNFEVKVLVTDGKDYVTKEWGLTVKQTGQNFEITGAAVSVINKGGSSLLGWLKSLF